MTKILITHNDLDGYGCRFVAEQVFPGIKTVHCDHHNFSEILSDAVDQKPEVLVVSDIWCNGMLPNETYSKLTDFQGEFYIFDHHPHSAEEQDSLEVFGAIAVNEFGKCATKQFAEYFNIHTEAIDLVNEYDTTGTIDGNAGSLNFLFYEYVRFNCPEKILETLSREPFYFSPEEYDILLNLEIRQKKFLESLRPDIEYFEHNGITFAFVKVEDHISYVSKTLLKEGVGVVVLFNKSKNKTSFRSEEFPVCSKLALALNGGGHHLAAGTDYYSPEKIKQTIQEVLCQ